MNTGLQDAYNHLAWKLALVVQDRANPALLDSYEQERLPVAQRLLATTDRLFMLPAGAPCAGDRFPWLKLKIDGNDAAADLYQQLADTIFHLLVIKQPAPADGLLTDGDLLQIHMIDDNAVNAAELARVNITGATFYLLRPDGHVALAGGQLDAPAVDRYLRGLGISDAAAG